MFYVNFSIYVCVLQPTLTPFQTSPYFWAIIYFKKIIYTWSFILTNNFKPWNTVSIIYLSLTNHYLLLTVISTVFLTILFIGLNICFASLTFPVFHTFLEITLLFYIINLHQWNFNVFTLDLIYVNKLIVLTFH